MNGQDFSFFEELLKKESGLALTPDKAYLLESRLMPIARSRKIETGLGGLVQKLRAGQDSALRADVVHAMTTNETSFFRDTTPFLRLKDDILPFFCRARETKTLRIWSAACSSGQEPYSIAMQLRETPALEGWRCEIVATDLSPAVLAQAQNGIYTQFEVQRGLPVQLLVKYFDKKDQHWQVKQEIRDLITFRPLNLLHDFAHLGIFDIIFCRNVLIYFDSATKARVLASLKAALKLDGALLLGGTESVMGVSDRFRPLGDMRGIFVGHDSSFALNAPATGSSAASRAALQKK